MSRVPHHAPPAPPAAAPSVVRAAPRRAAPRPAPLRVLLIIPQALDRMALVALLGAEADLTLVGALAEPRQVPGWRPPPGLAPDVVLLQMLVHPTAAAERGGLAALRRRWPGARLVALAPHAEAECAWLRARAERGDAADGREAPRQAGGVDTEIDCLTHAVLNGAAGVLRRDATPAELVAALRRVGAGGTWLDEATTRRLVRRARVGGQSERALLTPNERRVARQIAAGHSNKEAAAALGVSESTIKKQVGHLLRKLGRADRLQLGLFLAQHGYLLEEPPAATP